MDEDRAFLKQAREAQLEREREQAAKAKIRELAEKRHHPRDPRARSVVAALFSDAFLGDAIELGRRDDLIVIEDGRERRLPPGEFRKMRVLEPEDIVVVYAVGLTIEQGGPLGLHEPDRGLSTIADVPASLGRLRRNQLIEVERDGARGASGGGSEH
jgi:hypothetical protein